MYRRIITLTKYELLKIFRQPITVFFALIFPVMLVAFNGEIYGNSPSKLFNGVGTLDFVLPTTVFLIILVHSLSNLPLAMSMNINSHALKMYAVTELKKSEYIISILLSNTLWVILSTVVMFVFAKIKYGVNLSSNSFVFMSLVLVVSCSMALIGILIAVVVKSYQSVISISFLLYFTILFTSGAGIPLPVLPQSMQNAFQYSPFTHIANLLQCIWLERPVQSIDVVITLIVAIFSVLAVSFTFDWE